ncbi:MAG: alpha-galactosidase [Clostridiales bacterium]|nr:alpha-galactosidase [Clostridiales bacterium]
MKLKIAFIGAGSASFCPLTIRDIFLSDKLNQLDLELCLMDISEENMAFNVKYAHRVAEILGRNGKITSTTSLERALDGADFVITAIDIRRNYYWSMDYHIPRKYGSKQIFGENGGPGGMFHALRNMAPMVEIAKTMERLCPNALLINYSNPEAKLVEAVSKLTKVKVVGLCHGIGMGVEHLSRFLEIPEEDIEFKACGLNHFGWFQEIKHKKTGEDLYPLLREKEKQADKLALWDELALLRTAFKVYGLFPCPGANHIGEYISWAEDFFAGRLVQFYYDPIDGNPWGNDDSLEFIYSLSSGKNRLAGELFPTPEPGPTWRERMMNARAEDLRPSHEVGVPIMEAIAFNTKIRVDAVNVPNKGNIPGIQDGTVVEVPAYVDGSGIHAEKMASLPEAIAEMIRIQATIHHLLIEAYMEKSRRKLLQALLIDPNGTSYRNAVDMINEMCERQKEVLPEMYW